MSLNDWLIAVGVLAASGSISIMLLIRANTIMIRAVNHVAEIEALACEARPVIAMNPPATAKRRAYRSAA